MRAGHFALCEGTSADDAKVLHYKASISATVVALEDGYLLIRPTLAEQKIEASSETGFSPTLIEDTVKETLFNLFRSDESLRIDD